MRPRGGVPGGPFGRFGQQMPMHGGMAGMHSEQRVNNLEADLREMWSSVQQMFEDNNTDHLTLQDVITDSAAQVNDFRSSVQEALAEAAASVSDLRQRVTAEVNVLKASCALLQEEQRALRGSVRQLRGWQAEAAAELASLRAEHRGLRAGQGALCDCLVPDEELGQLQRRTKEREALAKLDAALKEREVAAKLAKLGATGGLAGLAASAKGMSATRKGLAVIKELGKAEEEQPEKRPNHELDEASWQGLSDFEPSQQVLAEWARSEMVRHAFGSFGARGAEGVPEMLAFEEVYSVFLQIGLSLERLVARFRFLPALDGDRALSGLEVKEKADEILRRMGGADDLIAPCNVYRLLEVLGYGLTRFKSIFKGDDGNDGKQQIGGWRIMRQLGQGFHGVVCYVAEGSDGGRAAVKWPASSAEIAALQEIHGKFGKSCPGVPRLLDNGSYEGQAYFVTDLLGSRLAAIFGLLALKPLQERVTAVCLIGRLVLRRLQALHERGYVHCDISPDNVMLGQGQGGGEANGRLSLFLIDYELAQRCPGGRRLAADEGSVEWSSIKSAEGGERGPEDDLEALGWVLLHGALGGLPWLTWLQSAYRDWDSKFVKKRATRQVQRAKAMMLEKGPQALLLGKGPKELPEALRAYLEACRQQAKGRPDYAGLVGILGGGAGEEGDLEAFAVLVEALNRRKTRA